MLSNITSDTFAQLKFVLHQLTDVQYTESHELLSQSSIGQHIRHILEFYICLADGIDNQEVNYDHRKRNIEIESHINDAQKVIYHLEEKFCNVPSLDLPMTNCMEYHGKLVKSQSSVLRELVYLTEHSIHHFAIVKIAIKNLYPDIVLPVNFGIAYSTSKHREQMESTLN